MLSAKIKDEPVNQMVSCKSSFASGELNEKWCFRDPETFRYKPKMCPTGGNRCSQWGCHGEQQVGLFRVYRGFIHSSAGGGMECLDKSGRDQGLELSLLTPHPAPAKTPCTHLFSWHFTRNCANQSETRVAPGIQICSVGLQRRARPLAVSASVSLLAC